MMNATLICARLGRRTMVPRLAASRSLYSSASVLAKNYPDHTLLPMPALSPTMEMGTIAKWELKEGDTFGAGSVICSVETDKATMDFEAQDDGIIAKILKQGPEAVDIPIGAPIAVLVEDLADVPAFADFVLDAAVSTPSTSTSATATSSPPPSAAAASASPPPTRQVSDDAVLLPSARFLAESK